jgi:ParB family transcriptional regulator, chromosome partitioning protein
MSKRQPLGRGLAALLGETSLDSPAVGLDRASGPTSTAEIIDLPIDVISRNPRQPRRTIDPAALQELAASIEAVGVVQPIIVRPAGERYELIAGERRWRAAQLAGFTFVPAIVRSASDTESLELALVENVVRQQLNPIDEAYALKVLLEDLGVTQENLASRVGMNRSTIANKVRLLDLGADVQELVSQGALSEGHGRALLGLADRGQQHRLAKRAADKGLSVRQVEEEVRRASEGARIQGHPHEQLDEELLDKVRESFLLFLGVAPKVRYSGRGGHIELPFKDADELHVLLDRIKP